MGWVAGLLLGLLLAGFPSWARTLEILAPTPTCCIESGEIVVIGRAPGVDLGTVAWAGNRKQFRIRDGGFSFVLRLDPGEQVLTFQAGGESAQVRWVVGTRSGSPRFRYHYGVERGGCGQCHQGREGSPGASAACFDCHRSFLDRDYLHEPVTSGDCAECHAPHGSPEWGFLRVPRDGLCHDCHGQTRTDGHPVAGRSSSCLSCHDPHGGGNAHFLREAHAVRGSRGEQL